MGGKLGGQVAKLNSFKGFFKSKYRARQEARRFIFYSVTRCFRGHWKALSTNETFLSLNFNAFVPRRWHPSPFLSNVSFAETEGDTFVLLRRKSVWICSSTFFSRGKISKRTIRREMEIARVTRNSISSVWKKAWVESWGEKCEINSLDGKYVLVVPRNFVESDYQPYTIIPGVHEGRD